MKRPYEISYPKDLTDYVLRVVADNTYLIFDRKRDVCRCSRCGTWHKISEMNDGEFLKHNEHHYCYDCNSPAICKESRYGRKNITECGRILWFRKAKSVTFAQLDEYIIDYTEVFPQVLFWPSAQYKFSKKEQRYFKHTPGGCWNPENWEERKNIKLPSPYNRSYYSESIFEKTVTHSSFISGRGTDLRYANLNMQRFDARDPADPYLLIGYIHNFLKYQSIELLEKSGFERIAGERARGYGASCINWRAKELRKILKLDPWEIREFRETKCGMNGLEKYKDLKKQGIDLKPADLSMFGSYNYENSIKKVEKYTNLSKAVKYLRGQKCPGIDIYADYLDECDKLGLDMRKNRVLFPEDLLEAHRQTSEQVSVRRDELTVQNFARMTGEIYPEELWSFGEYLIRAAESPQELSEESKVLGHCVRTYAKKVADGRCAILFIRKADAPDEPLFTLELSPDRHIVQCRGNHNCAYPEDVAEFLEHWKQEVLQKISAETAAA